VFLSLLVALHVSGWSYYSADIATRVRHPLHTWLKPSGYVGQAAGLVTFALFLFMWLYPLRKRLRWLARFGNMAAWLDVHIVAGLVLPFVGAVHAAWQFKGLIGLGYASMLAVCASGIVGRYLYTRIPRTHAGIEMGLDEIRELRAGLIADIAGASGLSAQQVEEGLDAIRPARRAVGIRTALAGMLADDLQRWAAGRTLRRRWGSAGGRALDGRTLRQVVQLARREIALTQRARLLETTRRIFGYWHVAHRPFAITAFLAVTIHVIVVVALGVTWFG
jgi:hypothetical protein